MIATEPKEAVQGEFKSTQRLDFLWLEVTQKCNLSCDHCYVSSGPDVPLHDRMRHEDWLAVIEQARALGCRSVQFIGGEPLLYPKIDELITHARDLGYAMIEVYSNGTPITARRAERFAAQQVQVACSVYSDNPLTHDSVTGMPGSFERTMAALRALTASNVPIRVGFIEMEANLGEFERTKKMLAGLGIERVACDAVRDFGRGSEQVADDRADLFAGTGFAGLCGQCSRGRLCVTYSGEVFPCIMSRTHGVGNVLSGGLDGVLRGEPIDAFRHGMAEHLRRTLHEGCPPVDGEAAECVPDKACMVCGPGVCHPDHQCSPDFSPCPPEVCTPQIAIGSSPADLVRDCLPQGACMVCGPGVCEPDNTCPPDHQCAVCVPNGPSKSQIKIGCLPDGACMVCGPGACQPDRGCNPDIPPPSPPGPCIPRTA